MRDRWFFAFFVISGFCALLCQVVWLRLAMAAFGVTTAMVSIVVSVFMAGLALGSALGGRLAARVAVRPRTLLALYAACELAIAASAQVVPRALLAGRALLSGSTWGSGSYHFASGACVAVAMLPFCLAMGATLPLALAAVGPRVRGGRSTFGHLYAANVLGAAAGTLAAALVLIEMLGLRRTLDLGAGLNALLAGVALALSLRATAAIPLDGDAVPRVAPGSVRALAFLLGTGFASMGMEVVWVRQFAPLLGNVVYAFAVLLASYLVATLVGSLAYRARSARLPASGPPRSLWIALALLSLLPVIASDPRLPGAPRFTAAVPPLRSIALVALAVAPLSALLGFVTPWLVDRWSGGEARRAGLAYAVNALGCIVGPLVGGFLLLPLLGERWSLFVLAMVILAPTALPWAGSAAWRVALAAASASVVVAVARGDEARFPQVRVRRDATATVLVSHANGDRGLLVNGVGMTHKTPITKFMAHLPLAFLGHVPQRGLVICFGMGTTFRSMHSWGIDTTAVELVPSVPALFMEFHPDAAGLLTSPRARVVVDDGRRFLDRTRESYDVVVIDPPPPVEAAGSSLLYSREFYEAVRRRLQPGGIVQAWSPGADEPVTAALLLAAREVFPHVRLFASVEGWGIHILASDRPITQRTAAELAARLPPAAAQDLVAWGPHPTAEEQLASVLRHEAAVDWASLSRRASALTDDRPINEYFFVRTFRHFLRARARG